MSAGATWFGVYFGIGLILMILALASAKRGRQADLFAPATDGTEFSAWYFIFIALLWPVWLLARLAKAR